MKDAFFFIFASNAVNAIESLVLTVKSLRLINQFLYYAANLNIKNES